MFSYDFLLILIGFRFISSAKYAACWLLQNRLRSRQLYFWRLNSFEHFRYILRRGTFIILKQFFSSILLLPLVSSVLLARHIFCCFPSKKVPIKWQINLRWNYVWRKSFKWMKNTYEEKNQTKQMKIYVKSIYSYSVELFMVYANGIRINGK